MRKCFWYIVLLLFCALQAKAQNYHIGDVITNDDGSQGVVFYINPERTGGWMVALNDETSGNNNTFKWGKKNTDVSSIPSISPIENDYYTVQILNTMPGNAQTQNIRNVQTDHTVAAWMVDFAHGWYLPSARELQYLYSSLAVVDSALYKAGGACMSDDVYWSSTEKDKDNAWAISFTKTITNSSPTNDPGPFRGGGFWFHGKDQKHRVRAIRNFTMTPSPSGFTYLWNTGETTPDITVSPSQSTTYSVTVSMGEGCEATEQTTVSVPTPPELEITTSTESDTICEGDEITLHAELKRPAIGDILCQDGSLVKLGDWPVEGKTAKGVVFYVDQSGQHGWAVSVTESQKEWIKNGILDVDNLTNYANWIPAIGDFNGLENTQLIHETATANPNITFPALVYVMGMESIGGYSWYLPAVGQLNVLFGSILAVNQSLNEVGAVISYSTTAKIWSSTESSTDKAMIIKCDNGTVDSNLKSASINVRGVIDF